MIGRRLGSQSSALSARSLDLWKGFPFAQGTEYRTLSCCVFATCEDAWRAWSSKFWTTKETELMRYLHTLQKTLGHDCQCKWWSHGLKVFITLASQISILQTVSSLKISMYFALVPPFCPPHFPIKCHNIKQPSFLMKSWTHIHPQNPRKLTWHWKMDH